MGPSVTEKDRNDYIEQLRGFGSSETEIQEILAQDDDFKDRVIYLLPENKAAFYWFLDVDDLWQYTEGMRTCLDIRPFWPMRKSPNGSIQPGIITSCGSLVGMS